MREAHEKEQAQIQANAPSVFAKGPGKTYQWEVVTNPTSPADDDDKKGGKAATNKVDQVLPRDLKPEPRKRDFTNVMSWRNMKLWIMMPMSNLMMMMSIWAKTRL